MPAEGTVWTFSRLHSEVGFFIATHSPEDNILMLFPWNFNDSASISLAAQGFEQVRVTYGSGETTISENSMNKRTLSSTLFFCVVMSFIGNLAGATQYLTIMTHDSFNVTQEVIAGFEKEHDVKVRFLKSGDAGAALIQAILSKNNPLADVFFGVDNTFFSRAIEADIFIPYASPLLADIPQHLQLDSKNRLLPVDYGDVCLNYDKAWFAKKELTPPTNLADLIKPEYKGLTVVQNPATSSPGMAFLLATIGRFGEDGYLEFWKKLKNNDVIIAGGCEMTEISIFPATRDNNIIVFELFPEIQIAVFAESSNGCQ